MKILLTGSDGYIGGLLGPYLVDRGHDVIGLDTGYYRTGWLCNDGVARAPACLTKDIRQISADDVSRMDAVVHLAELSNDPLSQINPSLTFEINHQGSVEIARLCREAGVARFVYTSSCSVYGAGFEDTKTEESEPLPQTAYAECKVLVERDVSAMANDDFSPTFLRNSTAHGASPRMRFDLVVNNLSAHAWTAGTIRMTSDGSPWRPLVHVLDICEAIACTLEAPREAIHNEIFNVGDDGQNYRIREVAKIVAEVFPGCELTIGSSDGDNRSYKVSFQKIREHLPDFRCRWDVQRGAEQLRRVFENIDMGLDTFEAAPFTRLRQIEHLLATGQVDKELYWTLDEAPAV